MEERYYIGQGRIYLGDRQVDWNRLRPLGNCAGLRLEIEQETFEHREWRSGADRIDLTFPTTTTVKVGITLEHTRRENWALALQGAVVTAAGGTFSETITAPPVGFAFSLARKNITSLSIAGKTAGVDYVVTPNSGVLFIPAGSTIAGASVTVNYTVGPAEQITALTVLQKEFFLYFDGLNIAENMRPVVVELFRVRFEPASLIELISEDVAQKELTGTVMYDATNSASGGYFRVTQTQPIGV